MKTTLRCAIAMVTAAAAGWLSPAASAADDMLQDVAREMREVQGRITSRDAGPVTQHLQSQIVSDLERVIEQARKSGSRSRPEEQPQGVKIRTPVGQPPAAPPPKPGKGGGSNSGQQNNPKAAAPVESRHADKAEIRAMLKQLWGYLPEHQREQMLQLPVEEFLPKYEGLIEEYFRQLSEGKDQKGREP